MTSRERVTAVVTMILMAVGAWFGLQLMEAGSMAAPANGAILTAVIAITMLTIVFAGIAAAIGGNKGAQIDERDRRLTLNSQVFRGFLYLALSFAVLGLAVGDGNYALVNGMFLAILGIETVSGLVMLALYRMSA